MKTEILFTATVLLLFFYSCEKEKKDKEIQQPFMSFKMNGTEYTFDITQFEVSSGTPRIFRIISASQFGTLGDPVPTEFPYWFDIRKSSTGSICAVLMPKEFPIPIDNYGIVMGECDFEIPVVDRNGNSLSADKIYYYLSGTINYSKSNCGNKSYFDINCLCKNYADMCDLSGTFELTFRNGLNETIKLSEGKLYREGVIQ